MNIYSIYVNPQKKDNDFVLIKQGFSFYAALFNIFWSLYHKIWLPPIVVLVFNICIFILNNDNYTLIYLILTTLVFGMFAVDIREYDLERKEYYLDDITFANSEIEAELKYLERRSI
jgi:hypothetical protein